MYGCSFSLEYREVTRVFDRCIQEGILQVCGLGNGQAVHAAIKIAAYQLQASNLPLEPVQVPRPKTLLCPLPLFPLVSSLVSCNTACWAFTTPSCLWISFLCPSCSARKPTNCCCNFWKLFFTFNVLSFACAIWKRRFLL